MRRQVTHWLLITLLLLSQAALSAHDADLDAHADDESCSVCLLSVGLDDATVATPGIVTAVTASAGLQEFNSNRIISGYRPTCRTRAPPRAHFSIL